MNPLIDNLLLVLAFCAAILMVKFSNDRRYRALASFFLLFAPFVIFFNMCAHIIAVAIVNYQRYAAGVFKYDFHFYSLMLFGIVFAGISGLNIHYSRKVIGGEQTFRGKIHQLNFVTALLFLPVFPINPIGLLPVIASVISSAALFLTKASVQRAHEYDRAKPIEVEVR